jgi:hypothetical protein
MGPPPKFISQGVQLIRTVLLTSTPTVQDLSSLNEILPVQYSKIETFWTLKKVETHTKQETLQTGSYDNFEGFKKIMKAKT